MSAWIVVLVSFAYIGGLFLVASFGDRRAERGASITNNPYVYALSLAVYCTAWTFYGSVGRAASGGAAFLPVYLGPTLVAALWWFVMRKIIRISREQRITSIADFISSRYGKGIVLGVLVTIIAFVGIVPYLALQLDGIATSFEVLVGAGGSSGIGDTALLVAILLGGFAVLFGTRHLDVTEHHEGLVAAIAVESVVKLVAFLAAGFFVTFSLFAGPGDLFDQAAADPELKELFSLGDGVEAYVDWVWLMGLSALAVMFLPRQFQMAVVENQDERHVDKAAWLFPLYLLIINLFVLPIAFAGRLTLGAGADADAFVLSLPLSAGQELLALFVFIGGLSAAASMVIVATVALSTMASNDLVIPLLLRWRSLRVAERWDVSALILPIRRVAIVTVMLLGYLYFRLTAGDIPLVSVGLLSFAAIAQFAPAIIGGLYWKAGNRAGAIAGIVGGALVWAYTLALPTLATAGLVGDGFVTGGPFGIGWLRPHALFGLEGVSAITNSMFWSMLVNVGLYAGVSVATRQSEIELQQAEIFVGAMRDGPERALRPQWAPTATLSDLQSLLTRFLGAERAEEVLRRYDTDWAADAAADAEFVGFVERRLAGAVGAGSARAALAAVVAEAPLTPDEVAEMIDETSRVLAYSRQLEEKRAELEVATEELQRANERLLELDRMKDEFVSAVSHELRTPLTSIKAFSEILTDNPTLESERRLDFLQIIQAEADRLTRHINRVLDLAKIESGTMEWHITELDLREVIGASLQAMGELYRQRHVELTARLPAEPLMVEADRDRVMQVVINLLSNAVKFCAAEEGRVTVSVDARLDWATVSVSDNGPGVPDTHRDLIFDRFRQVVDTDGVRPAGTGLGLPISREIVTHLGGSMWVEPDTGTGATFCFTLPLASTVVMPEREGATQ